LQQTEQKSSTGQQHTVNSREHNNIKHTAEHGESSHSSSSQRERERERERESLLSAALLLKPISTES
jgi:hypothetical protein